jgi:DNA-binding NtrC family response regulator
LAAHFLAERTAALGPRAATSFSRAALHALEAYDWPGNVRELANVVDRAIAASDGRQILPCHLAAPGVTAGGTATPATFRAARAAVVAAFERRYLAALLEKHGGNVTHAAREAQKERRAFGRLMKKHAIARHPAA